MSSVTIKGRISTTMLKAGEVATVEWTDRVENLVNRGYVAVVESSQGGASLTGVITPPAGDGSDSRGDSEGSMVPEKPEAPARSASKAEWVEFLTGQGVEIDDTLTRDDLVNLWHG